MRSPRRNAQTLNCDCSLATKVAALSPTKAWPTSGALFLLTTPRGGSLAPGTAQGLLQSREIRLCTSYAPYLTSAGRPSRHCGARICRVPKRAMRTTAKIRVRINPEAGSGSSHKAVSGSHANVRFLSH